MKHEILAKKKVSASRVSTDLKHQYFTIIYTDLEVTLHQFLGITLPHSQEYFFSRANCTRFFSKNQSILMETNLNHSTIFESSL